MKAPQASQCADAMNAALPASWSIRLDKVRRGLSGTSYKVVGSSGTGMFIVVDPDETIHAYIDPGPGPVIGQKGFSSIKDAFAYVVEEVTRNYERWKRHHETLETK